MIKFIKNILPYIVLFVAPWLVVIFMDYQHKREVEKLQDEAGSAYITLDDDKCIMVYDTIRDTIEVYKGAVREISQDAYKGYADKQLINDLGIKRKDIVQQHNQEVVIHDTVYLQPDIIVGDTTITFTYRDKWASFDISLKDTSLTYSIRDSLTTYISKKYKHKFLFFRWGKKGYDVNVVNHNPNAHIDKNTVIFVK